MTALADVVPASTAVGVLVGVTLLALIIAAGLVFVVHHQTKAIRRLAGTSAALRGDLAAANRYSRDMSEVNTRLRQALGLPPRQPMRRPTEEPTQPIQHTAGRPE